MVETCSSAKPSYGWIDVLKFLFCLCVIGLHTGLERIFGGGWLISRFIFRQAVPFFFVASGFFLGTKIKTAPKNAANIVLRYCKRLAVPLVVFSAINIVQQCISMIIDGYGFTKIFHDMVMHILFYPYGALWYMLACIVGAVLLIPFIKNNKINAALVIGFLLYLFALLCNNYYGIAKFLNINRFVDTYLEVFLSARNGIFVGAFMLALGMKCSMIYEKITKYVFVILGIGLLIYVVEIYFVMHYMEVMDDGALFISHILVSPSLLLAAIKFKCPLNANFTSLLRKLSVGMYLLHRPVLWCLNFGGLTTNPLILFVVTTLISMFICLLVYKLNVSCLKKLLA